MRGLEDESIDLIYLDPPFNSKHDYAAPIGSKASGAAFKDTWTLDDVNISWWGEIAESYPALYKVLEATRETGGKSMMSYLIYMAVRIMEMHRILKKTGSLYLHCDPTASHYLKLGLDAVFGKTGFKSEISWRRTDNHNAARRYGPIHDVIFFYTKSSTYTWNRVVVRDYTKDEIQSKFPQVDSKKRRWAKADLTGAGLREGDSGNAWRGCNPADIGKGRHWAAPNVRSIPFWLNPPSDWGDLTVIEKLDLLYGWNLVHFTEKGVPCYKRYYFAGTGPVVQDFMFDICQIPNAENLGYPTQKPLALLERIIKASSSQGDVVLDPFCGCATACHAAERLNRQWIGIDISEKAAQLIQMRINHDLTVSGDYDVIHRTDIPQISGMRTKNIKHILYGMQEGKCNGCCGHYDIKNLEVDHIVPRSKGGQDVDENLQLLCGHCNRVKGGKLTMAELKTRLKEMGMATC